MYTLIPFVLTAIIIIPIFILIVFLLISYKKQQENKNKMQNLFNDALDYENKGGINAEKENPIAKFITHYIELLRGAEIVKPNLSDKDILNRAGLVALVIYIIAFLASGFNAFIGLIPVAIVGAGMYLYANNKVNNIQHMMDEQIPSFLSTLKSNVQSNQTPARALVGAIDNTADPLYSELKIVKGLIETGTFETAMATLRVKTKSSTLKFLCSCIELSTEVGANLEDQIVIIEEMINQRKALDRKMDKAVAENKPLMWVMLTAVPGLFVYMYFMNQQTRSFWFHAPISWILIIAVILLLLFGVWAGNKVIDNVRKM